MADKLIYIPNDDTENYPFYSLQTVVETIGHSMNQPIKIQRIRKRYYKTLGTSVKKHCPITLCLPPLSSPPPHKKNVEAS